jgi:hypothetical protein
MENDSKPDAIRAAQSSLDRLDLLVSICRQVRTAITIPMTNPHEQAARAVKVTTLVAALRAGKITAELARTMDSADWKCAAKAAGVHPPSLTTCRMVINSLAESESSLEQSSPEALHVSAGGSR